MEYKYPKSITIGDTVFKVIYDYKNDGNASFQFAQEGKQAFIKIGMKHHKVNPLTFLNCVIHELKEIIQIEQSTRIYNSGKNCYEFHYAHAEHNEFCSRLAGLLNKFIK